MSEQEPHRSELSLADHDKILCFFTLDMADRMGDGARYTFTPVHYPELGYEKVEVSIADDQLYTVEFVYVTPQSGPSPDPDADSYTYIFTYYPKDRQLFLQEVVDVDILQKHELQSERYASLKERAYQQMIESLREQAKDDTLLAADLEKYDLVTRIIATGRNAVRNGSMDVIESEERTAELNQAQADNEMAMVFLFDLAASRDEGFAQQVKDYEALAKTLRQINSTIVQLEASATPQPVRANYLLDGLKKLAALEKSPEA